MSEARVKFSGREIVLDDRLITSGRATDNDIAFSDDANVSRYHAEIEPRGGDYWLIDLQSSNGTTVNGETITGERRLNSGDRILLGGSSEIEFTIGSDNASDEAGTPVDANAPPASDVPHEPEAPDAVAESPPSGVATEAEAASGGSSKSLLLVAGVLCGLALLCVVGSTAAYFFTRTSKCDAKATITSPEPGDTIAKATEIEVEAENTECVSKAVFTLDGTEIASSDSEPYSTTIDPTQFPDLADGLEHTLAIVLIDEEGKEIVEPSGVSLAFETRAVDKPPPTPGTTPPNTNQGQGTQNVSQTSAVTLLDIQQLTVGFVKQLPGGFSYNVSNKQLLEEVQKKIPEYAQEGFFDRAAAYRDVTKIAYIREVNLDARLGFILAMSRSKFVPNKQGDSEGLWQMSTAFVAQNGYAGPCGTQTLSDPSQECAAKASAYYMKAIVNAFEGDELYSAAAFGKSSADATAWKAKMPANRGDIWNVITTAPEREQLVRFLAAGIVAENPQKFGVKKDHPITELYQ